MLVDTKLLIYEKYLAMPEVKCRYEIIDGEVIIAPEVMRLSAEGIHPLEIFGTGMTVRSQVLEGLALPVAEIFA